MNNACSYEKGTTISGVIVKLCEKEKLQQVKIGNTEG